MGQEDVKSVIWKYRIDGYDEDGVFKIITPGRSTPLHVDTINHVPYLWLVVQPGQPNQTRRFRLQGTGELYLHNWEYVGTFQSGGVAPLVFHVFAEPEEVTDDSGL